MNSVNPYFLIMLLEPITGLADDNEVVRQYQATPLNSERQYKSVIKNKLVPNFNNLNSHKKRRAKLVLSYYLTESAIDFERVFESCLPPFAHPRDARNFFVWLWEELFEGEDYTLQNVESYRIISDINEVNRT